MKNNKRVEFCCHTKMSKLQGINDAKEYIKEAVERGYDTIAITDTNSTQAFFEVYEYFQLGDNDNEKIKIIYGIEMNFMENKNSENSYTMYIYVKEQKGLKNLYKLVSIAYKNIVDEKPMLYKEDLNKYRDGLLYASIGSKSEIYKRLYNEKVTELIKFYDFIGIETGENNRERNIEISKLCNKENKILIGVSNCNFINKDDSKYNEILNFYKKAQNIKEGNERYFHTTEELIKQLNYIENVEDIVVKNTYLIANQIEDIKLLPNRAHYPRIPFSDVTISKKCYDKAHEIYGEKLPKEVEERLQLELHSIIKNDFQSIYLICSELVEKSHELGYEVGTRGMIGNSFIAYLLGITNINPIEFNLPFELFAGKNYDKEPDIDLNFSRKIQDKIFEYIQKRFGKDKVIWGGTIGTFADRTVYNIYKEYNETYERKTENNDELNEVISRITGIKSCTGEHPGGVFIIPEKYEITDFCPTEMGENGHLKTHHDYHSLWNSGLYKFDILGHDDSTMLHELEKITKVNSKTIKLDDKETLELFLHANDQNYNNSTRGIPEFKTKFVRNMLEITKPKDFNDLVCISALSHGTDTWYYNAEKNIRDGSKKVSETISNREDLYNYLVDKGIDKDKAYDITEFIRKGNTSRGRSRWQNIRDKYKEYNEKWAEYKKIMQEHEIPNWYIESAEKITYMFPKSHVIVYTMNSFKFAWYKVHYPEAFYKTYFKIASELNIKNYYCKEQIKRELNKLYDEKEMSEYNREYNYDCSNNDKINDLEILLEMYNRGILKEKEEINDDYNLINSRAIADYCREIKHKFNTEELAVLVYRNNRMSIHEKISKYKDLIANYPDMEVIERINCKHYDSVKIMIKGEIRRLENLYNKIIKDEDAIYTWGEYNKSTHRYSESESHIRKTYKEVEKDVKEYVKEFDDTISYRITKRYFDRKKGDIRADFIVKNKRSILVNIEETSDNFLDIDQIFLNIPTPFKKGDILISDCKVPMRNIGDYGDIFVLEYLCTWREDLNEFLRRGNYDSSDMIGYGYYLYGENSTEFVRDHKWNYDSFEYYNGELTGNERILKDISSFVKEKIGLELFAQAFDAFKAENLRIMPDWYTDEGLRLAGFTEKDILKENHEK
ncbi:MAG: PHP domain-containing protein [Clostridia bacterium]|nr:PHP domain-containing protein [Clostridia bacterium]